MRSTGRIISAFIFALLLFGTRVTGETPQGRRITCKELFTGIASAAITPHPIPNATVVNIRMDRSTLVAEIAGGQPVRSNDAADILATVARSHAGATGPVYIDSTALQANRRAALEKSFENANRDSKLPLRYVEGLETLFSGNALREEMKVVDIGSNVRGEHYQRADVKVGGELFAMTVLCRVKAAAQTFMDRIRTYFGKPRD
ncbi:MAG: hypothetical protein QOH21_203, partial [Acidobacteriota bacterium]|nr:hypothetical protein [Acidobacteriota bacterium]